MVILHTILHTFMGMKDMKDVGGIVGEHMKGDLHMDKATLSDKDLDALLAWRDEHKDLVRSMPAPMKDIAIYLTDKSDVVLRSIRKSDSHLRIYMNTDGKPRGYVEYINRPPEGWFKTKDTLWRGPQYSRVPEELMKETAQSMFTV